MQKEGLLKMWQKKIEDKKNIDKADISEGFEQLCKYSREFSQSPKAQAKPWLPSAVSLLHFCSAPHPQHLSEDTP